MGFGSKRKVARRTCFVPKKQRAEILPVARDRRAGDVSSLGNGDDSAPQTAPGCTSILDLPDLALQLVFVLLGVDRLRAAQVCRKWARMADSPIFKVHVESDSSIISAIEACPPGGTVEIAAGYYQVDMLLIDKPIKMCAVPETRPGFAHRKAVLQSCRSIIALCNDRCYWRGLILRTANTANCGAVVFGAGCYGISFRDCEFTGHNGLCLPPDESGRRSLALHQCSVHDIRGHAAIIAYSGYLEMLGCRVSSCDTAVSVLVGARCRISGCDISFNGTPFCIDGEGIVENNTLWGNFRNEAPPVQRDVVIEGWGVATPHPAARGRQRRARNRGGQQKPHCLMLRGNEVKPNLRRPAPGNDGPSLQPKVAQLYRHVFGADRNSHLYWRLLGMEDISDDDEDFSVASSALELVSTEEESDEEADSDSSADSGGADSGVLPLGSAEVAEWDDDVSFDASLVSTDSSHSSGSDDEDVSDDAVSSGSSGGSAAPESEDSAASSESSQ